MCDWATSKVYFESGDVPSTIEYAVGGGPATITPDPDLAFAWRSSYFEDCLVEVALIERWTGCEPAKESCGGESYISSFDCDSGAFVIDTDSSSLEDETIYMALIVRPAGSDYTTCLSPTHSHPYSNCITFEIQFEEDSLDCSSAIKFNPEPALTVSDGCI